MLPAAIGAAAPPTPDTSLHGPPPARGALSEAYAAYHRGDYNDVITACHQVHSHPCTPKTLFPLSVTPTMLPAPIPA